MVLWVWWSPQKSNDWHKNPKSLTMATIPILIQYNNIILYYRKFDYRTKWTGCTSIPVLLENEKKFIFRLITLSLDFHHMI